MSNEISDNRLQSLLSSNSALFGNPSSLIKNVDRLTFSDPVIDPLSSDSSSRTDSNEESPGNIQNADESRPLLSSPSDNTDDINTYLSNPAILSLLFHGLYETSERVLKNQLHSEELPEGLDEQDKILLESTFAFGLLLRKAYQLAGRVVDAKSIENKLFSFYKSYASYQCEQNKELSQIKKEKGSGIYLYQKNNTKYAFIRHPNKTFEILNLSKFAKKDNELQNEIKNFQHIPENFLEKKELIKKIESHCEYTPLVILAKNNDRLIENFKRLFNENCKNQNDKKYWDEVWFNSRSFAVFFRNDLFVTLNLFRLLAIRVNRVMQNWVTAFDIKNTNIEYIKNFFGADGFSIFSIAFYAPRLILNFVALFYNTFYTPEMSEEQKGLGVWERFKIEFELRGGQILNDGVWLGVNLLVFCVSKGWIYFIPPEYAMLITVTLYIFDVFNSLYAYFKFKENADKALNELCLSLAGGDAEKAIEHKKMIEGFVENPENREKYFNADNEFNFSQIFEKLGIDTNQVDDFQKAAAFSALGVAMRNREELKAKFLTLIVAVALLAFMIPAALLSFHFSSAAIQILRITNAVSSAFPPLINLGVILLKAFPFKEAPAKRLSFVEAPRKLEKPKRNGCSGLFKNGQNIPMGDWGGTEQSNLSCFSCWPCPA